MPNYYYDVEITYIRELCKPWYHILIVQRYIYIYNYDVMLWLAVQYLNFSIIST